MSTSSNTKTGERRRHSGVSTRRSTDRPVTVTIHPQGPTEVSNMPRLQGSGNFDLIRAAIAQTRRNTVEYDSSVFTVAREHTSKLIDGLAAHFGRVRVIHYISVRSRCTSECWTANPNTVSKCKCACAGMNHGSYEPLGRIVGHSRAGDVSVREATKKHVYFVEG